MKLIRPEECIYCGKLTWYMNNQMEATCENEWICEGWEGPSIKDVLGEDPTGRNWRPE
jgi:hypothetical protein